MILRRYDTDQEGEALFTVWNRVGACCAPEIIALYFITGSPELMEWPGRAWLVSAWCGQFRERMRCHFMWGNWCVFCGGITFDELVPRKTSPLSKKNDPKGPEEIRFPGLFFRLGLFLEPGLEAGFALFHRVLDRKSVV